jgi:predicted O-methyltransferase YrrM
MGHHPTKTTSEMELLPPEIEQYLERHTSPEPEALRQLRRATHLHALRPQMLSGPVQGAFLTLLARLLQPLRVLEIGTYTGYSAICLAQAMPEGSLLYTIDVNEELQALARQHIAAAGLDGRIRLLLGPAAEWIPQLDETFDLVFIDADKAQYGRYYDLVFDKVRPGGYIVADNVLWYGKVADERAQDADTKAIRAFNEQVQADGRVENVMLSIRDGLMVARKR